MDEIRRRQEVTRARWTALETAVGYDQAPIAEIAKRACVYVTGSMARTEATEESDLDVFVVDSVSPGISSLSSVEYAHLLSWLDRVRLAAKFRPFSRGGHFLSVHSFDSMVASIGDSSDDARNAFTARMLLLINSAPLLNEPAYSEMRRRALDAYWYEGGSDGTAGLAPPDKPRFPIMLINDLRRWWGVVALNFERDHRFDQVKQDEDGVVDRRIANLKLRYARMLAVYSVILGVVADSTKDGVTRPQVECVLDATPIERLEVVGATYPELNGYVSSVLQSYDKHLLLLRGSKEDVRSRLSDNHTWSRVKTDAYNFHTEFTELFQRAGNGRALYEYCIV